MGTPVIRFRYTLSEEDGGTSYTYDPRHLMLQEATLIERVTGKNIDAWSEDWKNGSAMARGALIYLLKKRAGEVAGDFSKFDINLADIELELVDENGEPWTEDRLKELAAQEKAPKSGDDPGSKETSGPTRESSPTGSESAPGKSRASRTKSSPTSSSTSTAS